MTVAYRIRIDSISSGIRRLLGKGDFVDYEEEKHITFKTLGSAKKQIQKMSEEKYYFGFDLAFVVERSGDNKTWIEQEFQEKIDRMAETAV